MSNLSSDQKFVVVLAGIASAVLGLSVLAVALIAIFTTASQVQLVLDFAWKLAGPFIPVLATAAVGYFSLRRAKENKAKITEVGQQVNGQLEAATKAVAAKARNEGAIEGFNKGYQAGMAALALPDEAIAAAVELARHQWEAQREDTSAAHPPGWIPCEECALPRLLHQAATQRKEGG